MGKLCTSVPRQPRAIVYMSVCLSNSLKKNLVHWMYWSLFDAPSCLSVCKYLYIKKCLRTSLLKRKNSLLISDNEIQTFCFSILYPYQREMCSSTSPFKYRSYLLSKSHPHTVDCYNLLMCFWSSLVHLFCPINKVARINLKTNCPQLWAIGICIHKELPLCKIYHTWKLEPPTALMRS